MMTVGQHDDAWLNVMTGQVPNAVKYLKQLTLTKQVEVAITLEKEQYELGLTEKEQYAEAIKHLSETYEKILKQY